MLKLELELLGQETLSDSHHHVAQSAEGAGSLIFVVAAADWGGNQDVGRRWRRAHKGLDSDAEFVFAVALPIH